MNALQKSKPVKGKLRGRWVVKVQFMRRWWRPLRIGPAGLGLHTNGSVAEFSSLGEALAAVRAYKQQRSTDINNA